MLLAEQKADKGTKPLVIFVDFKSRRVSEKDEDRTQSPFLLNSDQYGYVKDLVQYLKEEQQLGKPMNAALQALAEGDYVYIYLSTSETVALKDTCWTDDIDCGKLIVMSAAESKRFFGILYPFYRSARLAYTDSGDSLVSKE